MGIKELLLLLHDTKRGLEKRMYGALQRTLTLSLAVSFIVTSISSLSCLSFAQAPITPSGLNTQVTLSSTPPVGSVQYDITGGTRAGTNLFHSFGNFNVPTNNIANFLNETALPTSNILGRVTGGNVSNIIGTIQTTGFGSANFYLMNPTGIVFGQNAQVNIGGAANFTTADYLRLSEPGNGIFYANPSMTSVLTSAPVSAFGFLSSNPAPIEFQGSQLTVAGDQNGTGVALIGGNTNLSPDANGNPSSITAHGRTIQVTSVAGPGEVAAGTGMPISPGMAMGTITLGQGTMFDTSGDTSFGNGSGNGGAISIRGGQLVAESVTILTNPAFESSGQGGAVTIAATGPVTLNDSLIQTGPVAFNGAGSAGSVSISADASLVMANTVIDASAPFAGGDAGSVTLQTSGPLEMTDSFINTIASAPGNGGAVTFSGKDMSFVRSGVFTDVDTGFFDLTVDPQMGLVHPGAVTVMAQNTVTFSGSFADDPGIPVISASAFGTLVDAGTVAISGKSVNLSNGTIVTTMNQGQIPSPGNGGPIEIRGNDISLSQFNVISANATFPESTGRGGSILLRGMDNQLANSIELTASRIDTASVSGGGGGPIEFQTKALTLSDNTLIQTAQFGRGGNAGTITVRGAENITVQSGSLVSTRVVGFNPMQEQQGTAGDILFETENLALLSGGQIIASAEKNTSGDAGNITVRGNGGPAQSVLIGGAGSGIFTTTSGTGAGGNISVNAQALTLQNSGALSASTSGTAASATGGTITITGGQLQVNSGGVITAQTTGPGNAGNVSISADSASLAGSGQINTSTNNSGAGGTVTIQGLASSAQSLLIDGAGSGIFTTTSGTGSGGNISVNAQTIMLQNQGMLSAATSGIAPSASGGTISVTASQVSLNTDALITAQTTGPGSAGQITISSGTLAVTGGAAVDSSTTGLGQGGIVNVTASQAVLLAGSSPEGVSRLSSTSQGIGQGAAGQINVTSPQLTVSDGASLATFSSGDAAAGNMTLNVGNLTLSNGGQLSSSTLGTGAGGTVTLLSPGILTVSGSKSGITSTTSGSGSGGAVQVQAGAIQLTNNGTISASSEGTGNAGSVNLQSNGNFVMNDSKVSTSAAQGQGGNIVVDAGQQIQMSNNALISASSSGSGNAGNIQITAGDSIFLNDSAILAKADNASGGDIKLTAPNTVELVNSVISTSVQLGSSTEGGNINIDPQLVILQNSQILANAVEGNGGNILIIANLFLQDGTSIIDASSQKGISGSVNIQSPISNLSQVVNPLQRSALQASMLLRERCAVRAQSGNLSSLTVRSREVAPVAPGGMLSGPLISIGPSPAASGASPQQSQQSFVTKPPLLKVSEELLRPLAAKGERLLGGCGS